jgi:hypothetical protein
MDWAAPFATYFKLCTGLTTAASHREKFQIQLVEIAGSRSVKYETRHTLLQNHVSPPRYMGFACTWSHLTRYVAIHLGHALHTVLSEGRKEPLAGTFAFDLQARSG